MKKDKVKDMDPSHMSFRQGQLDYDPNISTRSFDWDKPLELDKNNKT
jgi:hypothetical protein